MRQNKLDWGLSGSTLKLFAIIAMFIDHFGATVLNAIKGLPVMDTDPALLETVKQIYSVSRDFGRLAFPIFCYFIVEGFIHTRNTKKYAARLFLFALISEVPFDIALKRAWYYPGSQNVYFTLLFGLLALMGISYLVEERKLHFLFSSVPIGLMMLLAHKMKTDYSYKGVLLIAALYLLRKDRFEQCLAGTACLAWELPAPASFIPIYLYNGKRGFQMKYFFYVFYPAHLMLLWGITKLIR